MSILEQLGFKQKKHVGITISANNFIELVYVDKATKSIVKYSSNNINYNNSKRELENYEELHAIVEKLFEDVGLSPQECSVTLCLPTVHFGIKTVEKEADEHAVIEDVSSDVENLYIFKRAQPAYSWATLDNNLVKGRKNVVYGVMQTEAIAKILEILEQLETEVVRIEFSYSALFKALQFCTKFNKYLRPGEKAQLLLLTSNSSAAFCFSGPVVSSVVEEPLAVKSFSSEELYGVVSRMASTAISKNDPKSLIVISEIDEIDAQVLAQRINFAGDIECLNKSINNSEQFIDVYGVGSDIDSDMISYLTIEAVGAAVADYDTYPLDINFVPAEQQHLDVVQVGNYEIQFKKYLIFVLVLSVATAGVLGLIFNIGASFLLDDKTKMSLNIDKDIDVFHSTVERNAEASKNNILPIITSIVNQNNDIVNTYISLSLDIPETVYIRKFVTQPNGGIGILGEARTSEAVQNFVEKLKEKNHELMLTKLSINAQENLINSKMPEGYTFEIKTPNKDVNLEEDNIVKPQMANIENPDNENDEEDSEEESEDVPPSEII